VICRSTRAVTVTDAVLLADPPAPEQLSVYNESALSGPTASVPEVAFVPVQEPDAVHEVASVDDQVSVAVEPEATDAALAAKLTVGAVTMGSAEDPLPSLPPPQAASSRQATMPGNDRIVMWCHTILSPRCTRAEPPWRSASVRKIRASLCYFGYQEVI
jgi:hypothetical protein